MSEEPQKKAIYAQKKLEQLQRSQADMGKQEAEVRKVEEVKTVAPPKSPLILSKVEKV